MTNKCPDFCINNCKSVIYFHSLTRLFIVCIFYAPFIKNHSIKKRVKSKKTASALRRAVRYEKIKIMETVFILAVWAAPALRLFCVPGQIFGACPLCPPAKYRPAYVYGLHLPASGTLAASAPDCLTSASLPPVYYPAAMIPAMIAALILAMICNALPALEQCVPFVHFCFWPR
jgi:hypothetical protein